MFEQDGFASQEVMTFLQQSPGEAADGAATVSTHGSMDAVMAAATRPIRPPERPSATLRVTAPRMADVLQEIEAESEEAARIFDQHVEGSLTALDAVMAEIEQREQAGELDEVWALPDIRTYIDRLTSLYYLGVRQVERLGLKADVSRDIRDATVSIGYLDSEGTDGVRRAKSTQMAQMHQRAAAIYFRVYQTAKERLTAVDKKLMALMAKQRVLENEMRLSNLTDQDIRRMRAERKK